MNVVRPLLVLSLAATLSAGATAAPNTVNRMTNMVAKKSMTINLGALNGSKQDGQAFLSDSAGGLKVKVQIKNEPAGASEPAHIHEGTCAKLNPAPWKGLSNVVGGLSVTTIAGLRVADLKKSHYAINAHQSAAKIARYVSCGDL